MALTRRVPTPRTRCNHHHCWQCSSRCCRCRCCSPAVHRVRMDECRLLLPWGWLEFSSRKSRSRERRMDTRNVSTAAAGKRRFLSIGEESFRMYPFGKTLNYVIKALITLITTLDTVYQRPWHLIGAGPCGACAGRPMGRVIQGCAKGSGKGRTTFVVLLWVRA